MPRLGKKDRKERQSAPRYPRGPVPTGGHDPASVLLWGYLEETKGASSLLGSSSTTVGLWRVTWPPLHDSHPLIVVSLLEALDPGVSQGHMDEEM